MRSPGHEPSYEPFLLTVLTCQFVGSLELLVLRARSYRASRTKTWTDLEIPRSAKGALGGGPPLTASDAILEGHRCSIAYPTWAMVRQVERDASWLAMSSAVSSMSTNGCMKIEPHRLSPASWCGGVCVLCTGDN